TAPYENLALGLLRVGADNGERGDPESDDRRAHRPRTETERLPAHGRIGAPLAPVTRTSCTGVADADGADGRGDAGGGGLPEGARFGSIGCRRGDGGAEGAGTAETGAEATTAGVAPPLGGALLGARSSSSLEGTELAFGCTTVLCPGASATGAADGPGDVRR